MPAGQEKIYFSIASTLDAAKSSPHLEAFAKNGYEVLFFADPVDEWVISHLTEFDKRPLANVAGASSDLTSDDDKKSLAEKSKTYEGFLGYCKTALGDGVKEVRLTNRLTDSPCVMVDEDSGMNPQMEETDAANAKLCGYVAVLRDQALLAEGGTLDDAAGFAKRVQDLLAAAVSGSAAQAAKG